MTSVLREVRRECELTHNNFATVAILEKPADAWRHILGGSRNLWMNCRVLNEVYVYQCAPLCVRERESGPPKIGRYRGMTSVWLSPWTRISEPRARHAATVYSWRVWQFPIEHILSFGLICFNRKVLVSRYSVTVAVGAIFILETQGHYVRLFVPISTYPSYWFTDWIFVEQHSKTRPVLIITSGYF